MLLALRYPVMVHLGSLESTYRLEQLLRFFRALQTSNCVHHNSIVHATAWADC